MTIICETERLLIRQFNVDDHPFIIKLLNEDAFIKYIADKNVRTIEDAINYLKNGPIASYQQYGFGLNLVILKAIEEPIGMCGLLKRDELESPDLGYAFLSEYCGHGYAFESAKQILKIEMNNYQIDDVLAVTYPDNNRSNQLLKNIGFVLEKTLLLYGKENNKYRYKK